MATRRPPSLLPKLPLYLPMSSSVIPSTSLDDPNFPTLSSSTTATTTTTSSTAPPPPWTSARPTTAAQVVKKKPTPDYDPHVVHRSEKQQAELALYSKLVPTTSAVPRNPGALLGPRGLRATGSVVGKTQSIGVLPTSEKIFRNQPSTNRMRNLSSDASKPQLARRVAAKPNRPPSSLSPNLSSPNLAGATPVFQPANASSKLVHHRSLRANSNNNDKKKKEDAAKPDPTRAAPFRSRDLVPRTRDDVKRAAVNHTPRRLDEAFGSSTTPARRNMPTSARRTSALSPQPRPGGTRESSARNATSAPMAAVPPGFEARPVMSRSSLLNRVRNASREVGERPESIVKPNGRDNPLPRPKNARADALREALNSRRKSSSPRTASFRRASQEHSDAPRASSPLSSALPKAGSKAAELESMRPQLIERKNARPVSLPAKPMTVVVKSEVEHSTISSARPVSVTTPLARETLSKASPAPSRSSPSGRPFHSSVKARVANEKDERKPVQSQSAVDLFSSSLSASQENLYPTSNGHAAPSPPPGAPAMSPFTTGLSTSLGVHPPVYEQGQMPVNKVESRFQLSHILPVVESSPTAEHHINRCGPEALVNNLLRHPSNGYHHPPSSLALLSEEQNGPTSSGSLSSFDIMQGFSSTPTTASVVNNTGAEDVLPPLPSSQDVGFESMLRSMGWTPLDDEDTAGPSHNSLSSAVFNGDGSGMTEEGAGSYYTHFQ